jgi:hypothetical protein
MLKIVLITQQKCAWLLHKMAQPLKGGAILEEEERKKG